jgi:ferrous iron transport protein B
VKSNYNAFLGANNLNLISGSDLAEFRKEKIRKASEHFHFDSKQMQARETLERYHKISQIMKQCVSLNTSKAKQSYTSKIDRLLTHRIGGYLIFLFVLFLMFQAIFAWASYPMNLIDTGFQSISENVSNLLPKGILNDLFVNGILAGLNGIVVFIPQIALLFFFIAILEDTGYMARVSFIMDKLLRKFGLNGRSIIPLMSAIACAVPAIMSTRTIQNRTERLITIMVTPLMSCSARLPVFTLLTALVIPSEYIMGLNLQGLVLMGLYLIGFLAAIFASLAMKYFIKSKEKSYFVMELPLYRIPRWSTIGLHILEKVKIFLFDAGKIIIAISIILWVLSSFAPGDSFLQIENKYNASTYKTSYSPDELQKIIQRDKLESSYAGIMGKMLEPAIEPLGFDWKIGIALITSFAAREVFVGTMSTIYSVGTDSASKLTVKDKMMAEINPQTGKPRYSFAVGISLMLFYVFAMQCMSTLAVVYRETRRMKWPIVQFVYMSGLAYFASLIAYQLLKP